MTNIRNMSEVSKRMIQVVAAVDDRGDSYGYECEVIIGDSEAPQTHVFFVDKNEYSDHYDAIENEISLLEDIEDIFDVNWEIEVELTTNIAVDAKVRFEEKPCVYEYEYEKEATYEVYLSDSNGNSIGSVINFVLSIDNETHEDIIIEHLKDEPDVQINGQKINIKNSNCDFNIDEVKIRTCCCCKRNIDELWYTLNDEWICSECNEIVFDGKGD